MLCGSAEQGNLHHAGSLSDLASEMQLVPKSENPFSHHPTPMQTGRKLQATGRTQDAALAFEAAGMVGFPPHSLSRLMAERRSLNTDCVWNQKLPSLW